MADNKFIVFKRDEFITWIQLHRETVTAGAVLDLMPESLKDSVVIRKQDVFAPPALDAYANSIMVANEALKAVGIIANTPLATMVNQLHTIADYFHAAAADAWESTRKIPTP